MIWYIDGNPLTKNQQCAVPLGVEGENGTLVYTADVSDWLAAWPNGIVALLLKAPDRSDAYVADTALDRQTGTVTWTISSYDTAIPGYGWGELRIVQGEDVKKSWTFRTYIRPGILAEAGDPPAPTPDWVDDLLEEASEAMAATRTNAELAGEAADNAADAQEAAEIAQARAEQAAEDAEAATAGATSDAEAWACGTRDGVPVSSDDVAYHNNSKYYSEQAGLAETGAIAAKDAAEAAAGSVGDLAEDAEAWAIGKRDGQDVPSSDPAYHNNAKYYSSQANTYKNTANNAKTAAQTAQAAAETAQAAAEAAVGSIGDEVQQAEAWAAGTRDGQPVPSTDPAYQNNAAYYAGQAGTAATAAAGSAASAASDAEDAEAYGAASRGGQALPSTDPAYQNNAKYYSSQAAEARNGANTAKNAAIEAKEDAQTAQAAAEAAAASAAAAAQVTVVTPAAGASFTLDPCPVTYSFGERAELTLTMTATTQYHFMFTCPSSAATVLTMAGITKTGDELAAGGIYEVDVWAGIARISEVVAQ